MKKHDRQISITVGNNRKSVNWQPRALLLSEFYRRLQNPVRSTETMAEYLKLTKSAQDDLKDVGGFVAGTLSGVRRKAGAVTGRDLITLDFDNIPPDGTEDIIKRVDALDCGYCIYSTRKHTPETPRLRILLPLDRTATVDEYEPLARHMAAAIGIECADPTTFEASRLMYWSSCCADGEFVFKVGDKPLLPVDKVLAEMGDWHDMSKWAQVPGAENLYKKLAAKQVDPESKSGIIGAFCRTYDIYGAMAKFLPNVYAETATPGRYTYLRGSTTGGAIVYGEGKFLYSHHASDPCCGRLVNAFDLVRLHKFGDLDDEVDPKTPTNRLPSYHAMGELAANDADVAKKLAEERVKSVIEDFGGDLNWAGKLELNGRTGSIKSTIDNIWLILENDPNLKGKFALNEFSGRAEVLSNLPWCQFVKRRPWSDNDTQGLYWYFEKYYKVTGNVKIDGALSLHSEKHKFNEVKDYLLSIKWDGVPRLDTLLVDYLGAADNSYVRAVTRKAFTAAVARAMDPGCKYDTMLILSGPQGLGKSLLLDTMSKGWFNDTIRTFEGKEASELLQGVWIVEIGELDAFRRTDVARIKQFLSQRFDRFRAAYGRHVQDLPRRCVFFGTTNAKEFLSDRTGNRRFWVVDVGDYPHSKIVWRDLNSEVEQIWAEATLRWRLGESLFLVGAEEEAAKVNQDKHRESNGREGVIAEFLDKMIPRDWAKWSLDNRRVFWSTNQNREDLVQRDKVCALEIWCEALGGQIRDLKRADAQEINDILRVQPDWEQTSGSVRFGYCGKQRGFQRK